MLKSILTASVLLTALPAVGFAAPSNSVKAQSPPQPTTEEIYQACTQNRAETLPNPFVDVSPKDWAYKAVLTMHYCGAFRQAAPRSLFDRTQPTPQSPTPQS
ncbi:MAG: hypothetical protein C4288_13875 [Leptolyngbya sp. ERB_1_1]